MKTYCFNYSVQGELTFLPRFACVDGWNKLFAWSKAKNYLTDQHSGRKVTVYYTDYPEMIDKEFQSIRIPN